MKFFTRTDTNVTKQTTKLFIEYAKTDKKRFLSFATLIPLGQVLEYVIVPRFSVWSYKYLSTTRTI